MSIRSSQSMERQGSGLWRSLTDGDFEEEDIWDVLRERKDSISRTSKSMDSSVSVPKQLQISATRMIPKPNTNSGTGSNQTLKAKHVQQSAPVTIPNWPKNCPKKDNGEDFDGDDDDGDCDDDVEEETSKMPPHELIAKRLARSHISSFSVLEGVGRKLKGRDLSEVRKAVLAKTGFL